jgi:hypothetical protein
MDKGIKINKWRSENFRVSKEGYKELIIIRLIYMIFILL